MTSTQKSSTEALELLSAQCHKIINDTNELPGMVSLYSFLDCWMDAIPWGGKDKLFPNSDKRGKIKVLSCNFMPNNGEIP